jgi:hypothetical protein
VDAVRAINRCSQNLVQALDIYESQNMILKSKVEAFLLTDLTFEDIASRINVSAAVVETYTAAFFSVREETAGVTVPLAEIAKAYKDAPHETLVLQYLWKRAAIVGGADALESLINAPQPTTVEDATAAAASEAKVLASFKIAEATKTIVVTEPNSLRALTDALIHLRDVAPPNESQELQSQVDALLKKIPFSVNKSTLVDTSADLAAFRQSPVELSLNEEWQLHAGLPLENPSELLELDFPMTSTEGKELSSTESIATSADIEFALIADQESQVLRQNLTPPRMTSELIIQRQIDRFEREQQEVATKRAASIAVIKDEARVKASEGHVAEAEQFRQDAEWLECVGDCQGAARNRKWAAFRRRYPNYAEPETRKRLAELRPHGGTTGRSYQ